MRWRIAAYIANTITSKKRQRNSRQQEATSEKNAEASKTAETQQGKHAHSATEEATHDSNNRGCGYRFYFCNLLSVLKYVKETARQIAKVRAFPYKTRESPPALRGVTPESHGSNSNTAPSCLVRFQEFTKATSQDRKLLAPPQVLRHLQPTPIGVSVATGHSSSRKGKWVKREMAI